MSDSPRATELAAAAVTASTPWPPPAIAVDATMGNGHDTVLLARCVGDTGQVFAFDIQPEAIAATRARLREAGLEDRVTCLQAGHEEMVPCLPPVAVGCVSAILFNLGYLPGGDKSRITTAVTTRRALDAASAVLAPGGLVSVVAYTGHPGAAGEAAEVERWMRTRAEEGWSCFHAPPANPKSKPPIPYLAWNPGRAIPPLPPQFEPLP